jgi:hypothetical protein
MSLSKAADLLTKHSGGKISTALRSAIELGSISCTVPETVTTNETTTKEQIDENVQVETKQKIFPPKQDKNPFDCFDCWRGK